MKVLITGGSGFLGFHLIQKLLNEKHTITILDRNDLHEKELIPKLIFFKGDVRDEKLVLKTSQDQDLIIHAAASLPLESANQITTTTIDGTRYVLSAAKKHKIPRVVYISSTAVYGIPDHHPLFETDRVDGVGPYGIAKIEAERLCRESREDGQFVSIIRPKTFIGTQRLGVFQILFNWVRLGKRIPIIGNGHNHYQLLEVEDLVEAIMLVGTTKKKSANDVFNVGAQKYATVLEDMNALCTHAGTGAKPLPIPAFFAKVPLRILDQLHLSPLYKWVYETADQDSFVSVEKIVNLGWQANRSNAQSLINAYDWYIKNYQDIEGTTGTDHRVGWDQGALNILKKFL